MTTTTTTATDDIDWHSVADQVRSAVDDIRPATGSEVLNAIEDTHGTAPLGIIEDAVQDGRLVSKGDDEYSFRLPAESESSADDDEETDSHITDDGRQYAPAMVARDSWVLRTMPGKDIRAPWQRGNLKRVRWRHTLSASERPETDFETALSWADFDATTTLETHDNEEVEYVAPSFLLAQDVGDPKKNIIMVDLDDVRDPETGHILPEAQDIIDRLNSYAEISTSGTGVHVFVLGTLPDWYSGHELDVDLETDERVTDESPGIEIYHRRRHCVTTGNHVEGTPDDVKYAHDTIDNLVEKYDSDGKMTEEELLDDMKASKDTTPEKEERSTPSDISPYYTSSVSDYATLSGFAQTGGQLQGPHPVHGSSHGSTYAAGGRNCTVTDGSVWYCHSKSHNSSGGALALCAVDEGYIDCSEADAELSALTDVEFARVCLDFRDSGAVSAGDTAPYRALLGLAKANNLADDGDVTFDPALRDVIEDMWERANASML